MTDPISSVRMAVPGGEVVKSAVGKEWGFLETLHGAMDQVNELQGKADTKVASVLDGSGMDVHSAMIAVEKADLSFQMMMQVRNKIVAAYQEVSRMQF